MKYFFFLFLFIVSENCIAQQNTKAQYKYIFTVAKDGTGEYNTIQDAIDAMRVYPLEPITLYIKKGVYQEKIELPATNVDVTFIGEDVDSTIITWNDYSGKGKHTTFTSYTARISGNRFCAKNITFANSAGPVGQALALYIDADNAVFYNCKFLGNQDTIFVSGETAKQLFINCYIEGTTDFIFGSATAVFSNCSIRAKSNSFITAASTPKEKPFGFVFINCNIKADTNVTKLFLGRPWRAFAQTVFIECNLPKAITAAGWDNWGNANNEKTALYAEYKNTGDGAIITNRVNWSKQLSGKEAKKYTLKNIFKNAIENKLIELQNRNFSMDNFTPIPREEIFLYAKDAARFNTATIDSLERKNNSTRIVYVPNPSITAFVPANPNGMAVIICPGGGYQHLSFTKEGTEVASVLNKYGITAFVLKYRLPNNATDSNKKYAALQDAQEAIRYVRNNAKQYKLKTNKIGILGFSAGGHLAATAATHFTTILYNAQKDTTSARPDFAALIYPVISMDTSIAHKGSRENLLGKNPTKEDISIFSTELKVSKQTPPSFIVHANDDKTVKVENSIRYYNACIQNKVPVELHIYNYGGHGFGLNNKTTEDKWIERFINWVQGLK